MKCVGLHVEREAVILIRNYSHQGIYFESERSFIPGSHIILREMDAEDRLGVTRSDHLIGFSIHPGDPAACTDFRSHVLARVQRCEALSDNIYAPRFGIGAEIQYLDG